MEKTSSSPRHQTCECRPKLPPKKKPIIAGPIYYQGEEEEVWSCRKWRWHLSTNGDSLEEYYGRDIGRSWTPALPTAMNCISWNCRGLGNPGTIQELARLVREKDPSIVFLSETWMDDNRLELLRCRFHFSNKFVVK
jgi:hypothetical protein